MKKWLIVAACLMAAGLIVFTICLGIAGFDFARLGTQKMVTNTYTLEESFSHIRLDTVTADIALLPSEDGQVKVVCYEEDKLLHTVQVEKDALVIRCDDTRKWYDYISVNFTSPTVTVYLPAGEYEAMQIYATTGDVSLEGVNCGALEVKTTTGDVRLRQTRAIGDLTVNAATGDVELDRVDAQNISVKVTTGDVTGSILSSKVFVAKATTGEIQVPKTTEGGLCQVTTTTGDISLEIVQ